MNRKEIIYIVSLMLLVISIYLVYQYTNNVKIMLLQASLTLLTPHFWINAIKYVLVQTLSVFLSDTTVHTLKHMIEKHIQLPYRRIKIKTLSWYSKLNKFEKYTLWLLLGILGVLLVLLVIRSPLLIKLFWKKILSFSAGRGIRAILAPYIKSIVLLISALIMYRFIKYHLITKVVRPIRVKVRA